MKKQFLPAAVAENAFLGRVLSEKQFRAVAATACKLVVNIAYALYNGFLGFASGSLWFSTMCVYYLIFTVMRTFAVASRRKREATEYRISKAVGILISILSLCLSAVIFISLSEGIASVYGTIPMITIALYTFIKLTLAITKAVKQRNHPSHLLAALRCITYAEVAASFVSLQRSMLVSFEGMTEGEILLMNSLTGAAACTFIFTLGITLILKRRKYHAKIKAYRSQRKAREDRDRNL